MLLCAAQFLRHVEDIALQRSGGDVYRLLLNGHITHGFQYESVEWCNRITTYYTYGSGVELAMRYTPENNKRVGVVGLGVGTMAGFAEAGDQYWLYDINPAVVNLSANEVAQFTYCINARDRGASVEIVPGDAAWRWSGNCAQRKTVNWMSLCWMHSAATPFRCTYSRWNR